MSTKNNIARLSKGGRIDRAKPLTFSFDGKQYTGYQGDTLASALLANGVKVVSRSFKTHRPRGITAAGPEEAGGIVQLGSGGYEEPNPKATQVELYNGLVAKSVNCWPNAENDLLAVTGVMSKLFSAGFYYKTFMWPNWKYFRPLVRKMAGLGTLPTTYDAERYEKRHTHCEVLIIGGGPAGIAAALSAAESDARVVLVEDQHELGGSLLWENSTINGKPAIKWVSEADAILRSKDNVSIMTRTTATGYYDHNLITLSERVTNHLIPGTSKNQPRERFWRVRATQVILATGSFERPLVFPNNDRPGVMLASAARHYINRFSVQPGKQAVVFTNNDSAYQTALDLKRGGVNVMAVIDVRADTKGQLVEQARQAEIEILAGYAISNVKGRKRIKSVEVCPFDTEGTGLVDQSRTIECDLVCVSGGWSPTVHLFSQSGGSLEYDDITCCFRPKKSSQQEVSIGAANGDFSLAAALQSGSAAGAECAGKAGFTGTVIAAPIVTEPHEQPIKATWQIPTNLTRVANAKRFVDLQHDVHANDVELAARENYISVEHFKRYTTTGMACDQGKTSNVNGLAILGEATGRAPGEVGTTKFRPPYTSVTIGNLAGPDLNTMYQPSQHLPMHTWHLQNGGQLEDYGSWKRAAFYRQSPSETEEQAIEREVLHTRSHVSLLDYSSLTKVELKGQDAAEFVNRLYANTMKTLKNGVCRYGLVLNEHGLIVDDGVLGRLADDHFIITTTSGGGTQLVKWLEKLQQVEWPDLDVAIAPQTTYWATLSLTGPKARDVLSRLECDIDLSGDAFPHMSVRTGTLEGMSTRIFRVSFTGELGYEINIPVSRGPWLWQRLLEVGAEANIAPLGIEALDIMRTEKGFLHVGLETDSSSVPADVGWGVPVGRKQGEFIGKRSLAREEQARATREQLVGLKSLNDEVLPFGAQVVPDKRAARPVPMEGRVTTSYYSPTLRKPLALGVLADGNNRKGEIITLFSRDKYYQAEVVSPVFYDPEGVRINA